MESTERSAERGSSASGLTSGLTAIVAALPEEASWLRRRLEHARPAPGGPRHALLGTLGSRPIALAVTGDGAGNAREGLDALVRALPIRRLLVIGVSGALSPNLEAYTLLVAERVIEEGGRVLEADQPLWLAAMGNTTSRLGVLVSANRLADSAAEKRRLLALSGTRTEAAAVDLESAAYATSAMQANIPWLFLRAIIDTAEEPLPAVLNTCRDRQGSIRRAAVVGRLLLDPRPLPALLTLRRRVRRCAGVLGRAAEAVLTALPSPA
jgi:adenosylhomocysteine nucleosidase